MCKGPLEDRAAHRNHRFHLRFAAIVPSPPALFPLFPRSILGAGILVQEEYGPVLAPYVGLVGQHQLGQHGLVAGYGTGVLVPHH